MKFFLVVLFVALTLCSQIYGHGRYPRDCTERTHELEEELKELKEKVCTCKKNAVPCPSGFTRHEDKCFWFARQDSNATWAQARTLCESMNSYLAIITSASQTKFINDTLMADPKNVAYWIGAHDLQTEGTFLWSSKGLPFPMTYTDWFPGQPNNENGTQNCAEVRDETFYHWNDYQCYSQQGFICMYDLNLPNC